jgi:amino acid transporter
VYNPQTVQTHEAQPREPSADAAPARQITLGAAISLNVMNMIGVGPFITLPLVAAALGPGAWMGWLLGAALAVCDGLVWAELGAALPRAGGSYAFLREIYKPGACNDAATRFDAGQFLSFLYVWQLMFTAPLSMASGALGLAQYAAFLFPGLETSWHIGSFVLHATSLLAASVCLLVVALLHRGLGTIVRTAELLSVGVLLTVLGVIVVGATHLHAPLLRAQLHPLSGLHGGLLPALGVATLITTYDYWGYYNVCFLGGEVREPGRTIPRAVLLSIAVVACLYLLMNFAVLSALPISHLLRSTGAAQPMAAVLMRSVFAGRLGAVASVCVAVLIIWTAFASIVALLLGYSRAPYAAAREGNFFAPFARLHPRLGFPQVSLVALGLIATSFCFFDLRTVIASLVAVRIVLQYGLQQTGVMVLRVRQPQLVRPFRMWVYPLPPLLALAGFGFLLFSRRGASRELLFALVLAVAGSLLYAWRARAARHA